EIYLTSFSSNLNNCSRKNSNCFLRFWRSDSNSVVNWLVNEVNSSKTRTISCWISRDFSGLSGQGIGILIFTNLFLDTLYLVTPLAVLIISSRIDLLLNRYLENSGNILISDLNLNPKEKLFRKTLASELKVTAEEIPASLAFSEEPVNNTSPYLTSY